MPPLPQPLKFVACLFVCLGVLSVLDVCLSLVGGHFIINVGVMGLFIGPGLLRLSLRWLAWAMFYVWAAMAIMPLALILSLTGLQQGIKVPSPFICIVIFGVAYHCYEVLCRPGIKRLFTSSSKH